MSRNIPTYQNYSIIEWILRVGISGMFLGHGLLAWSAKASWVPLLEGVGVDSETAVVLLPLIGVIDIVVALIILLYPIRIVVLWASFWGFATALSRPIAGESLLEFVERSTHWAAPLALLLILGWPTTIRGWFQARNHITIDENKAETLK